jgi:hypothetical protein
MNYTFGASIPIAEFGEGWGGGKAYLIFATDPYTGSSRFCDPGGKTISP